MVPSQPTLRNSWLVILHDMSVIADEQECTVILQVELHANQSVRVSRQVVQRDSLGEIDGAVIERLPVQLVNAEIVREVDTSISASRTGEES